MLRLFARTSLSSKALLKSQFLPRTTYQFSRNMGHGQATNDELKSSKLFDVSHVTAIVTGGATGIGLMITQGQIQVIESQTYFAHVLV